jgi:ectoine hydroxylase-related dioxygenase (phytanoyl-CoA dioxygenase family)
VNGPLWVIPGINHLPRVISRHADDDLEAGARMVCAQAGDAVIFHCTTYHAGGGYTAERMPLGRAGW